MCLLCKLGRVYRTPGIKPPRKMFSSPRDFKVAFFLGRDKVFWLLLSTLWPFSVSGNVCLKYVDETLKGFFPFQRVNF